GPWCVVDDAQARSHLGPGAGVVARGTIPGRDPNEHNHTRAHPGCAERPPRRGQAAGRAMTTRVPGLVQPNAEKLDAAGRRHPKRPPYATSTMRRTRYALRHRIFF